MTTTTELECNDCGDLIKSGKYCDCCAINYPEEIKYPKFSYADFLAGK